MKSGRIGQVFHSLMEDFKPEAAYFFPENGQRSGFMIVNVTDSSDLARVAESFWHGLHADISVTPVMNGEDLGKGLGGIEGILKRYA
ncbi:MAG TPA: DUF3303 family protein [Mariprofundaceae bacterium]|nr:DUF3303 family protein [Mariprofundaceae bacterium]